MKADETFFQKQVGKNYKATIDNFQKFIFSFALFKIGAIVLIALEFLIFLFFASFMPTSFLMPITIGIIFLSIFSFLVLLFYFQAKRPLLLENIKEKFIFSCRKATSLPSKTAEHHLSIAGAALKLVAMLDEFAYKLYKLPAWLSFFKNRAAKWGKILHENDLYKMKESLLLSAIGEHLEQIQVTPTDLEIHASLANSYVNLAKLYMEKNKNSFWLLFNSSIKNSFQKKFEIAAQYAIEEYKILVHFAPSDPWVHAQLASAYKSLKHHREEAQELLTLTKLSPNDNEVFYRLGVIYFETGQNAKGLKIYEKLKNEGDKKAETLISFYGSLQGKEFLEK